MLFVKKGVFLSGLHPEMLHALDIATKIYETHEKDCVLTSARGGKHSNHSHHYKGLAIDLRTRHLAPGQKKIVADQLQEALGDEYQVVIEPTHIHCEYDPEK